MAASKVPLMNDAHNMGKFEDPLLRQLPEELHEYVVNATDSEGYQLLSISFSCSIFIFIYM